MIAAARSELRKFFSTRMWWVLLLIAVAYLGGMAALMVIALFMGGDQVATGSTTVVVAGPEFTLAIYTLGVSLGYIFPAIVGALSVSGEYRHQTITPTLLAEPRRPLVLAAKIVAAIPVGALFGVAITIGCTALAAVAFLIVGQPTGLSEAHTWVVLARSALALTVWAIVGVGLGALIKNQVAAIVTLLAFTQFVEPLLRMLPFLTDRAMPVLAYLPGAAGDAISGQSFYAAMGAGVSDALSVPAGLGVLVAYGLVLTALGYVLTFRRDVT
jgi:ABC-type transport system involved in multi-copper enzyme maturation permease subunit